MSCTVERRNRVREAAQQLGELEAVLGVDVIAPDASPTEDWGLEATLSVATVPPAVLRELAIAEVPLRPDASGTQGQPERAVVVATAV